MGSFRIVVLMLILAAVASGEQSTPSVTVWVYNYANVSPDTLAEAKELTSWVMKEAGLKVKWVSFGSGVRGQLAGSDLVLRLVPETMVASWDLDAGHLAFSLVPPNGRSVRIAGVITDRVAAVASREHYPLAMVLGHVIAHELGHLLLGNKRHSDAGVMSFPVNRKYLVQASKGQLRFTPSQRRRMHGEVRRRSGTQTEADSPLVPPAKRSAVFLHGSKKRAYSQSTWPGS